MLEVRIIGLDLAKNVFQAHVSDASGATLFRMKLCRDHVLRFLPSSRLARWRWRRVPAAITPLLGARDR